MFYLAFIILIVASCIGAFLSVKLRAGEIDWWWCYGPGLVTASIWIYLTKTKIPLPTVAILYDVVVSICWLGVMVKMGENLTRIQTVGAGLAIVGLGLMALKH